MATPVAGGAGSALTGGSFLTVSFPGLLEGLQAVVDGAPELARALLAEEVDVALSVLRGKASDPSWYGVRETIAALEEGAANPIELVADPVAGLYQYGAGRIVWTTDAGSAPPDSIKTFMAYYRSEHPDYGNRPRRVTLKGARGVKSRPAKMSRADQRAVRTARRDLEVARINRRSAPLLREGGRLRAELAGERNPYRRTTLEASIKDIERRVNVQAQINAAERFILQKPLPRTVIADLLGRAPESGRLSSVTVQARVVFAGYKNAAGQIVDRADAGARRYYERDFSKPPLTTHRLSGGLGHAVGAAYRAEAKRLGGAERLVFQRSRSGPGPAGRSEARVRAVAEGRLSKNSTLMRSLAALPGTRVQELLRLTPTTGEGYIYGGGAGGSKRFGLRRYASVRVAGEAARTQMAQVRHIAGSEGISLQTRQTTARPDLRTRGLSLGGGKRGPALTAAKARVGAQARTTKVYRGDPIGTERFGISMKGSPHLRRIPGSIATNVGLTRTILVIGTFLTDHYHDKRTAMSKVGTIINSDALKGGHSETIHRIFNETRPSLARGAGVDAVQQISRHLSEKELKAGELLIAEMHRQIMQLPSSVPGAKKEK